MSRFRTYKVLANYSITSTIVITMQPPKISIVREALVIAMSGIAGIGLVYAAFLSFSVIG